MLRRTPNLPEQALDRLLRVSTRLSATGVEIRDNSEVRVVVKLTDVNPDKAEPEKVPDVEERGPLRLSLRQLVKGGPLAVSPTYSTR